MNTEYKGFHIYINALTDRVMVDFHAFNSNGYATLNNAKGAITKHLNARAERVADAITDVLEQVIEQKQKDRACQRDEDYWDDVCKMARQDQCDAKACAGNGADVLAVPVLPVPVAQQKPIKAAQSRNKREGRYAGKTVTYAPKGCRVIGKRHCRAGGVSYL